VRLTVGARLRILYDLLAGLHYAHELCDYDGEPLEVVHRDVNPQNVFVTYDGHVKLVDFGIAKAMDSLAQTKHGMFKGKLAYMAPEQVRGGPIDRRADLFAVGVMLAECVTSSRLWPALPELELANRLAAGAIPWPPQDHAVPASLTAIVARALAVDPALRFSTAEEMRTALGQEIVDRDDVPSDWMLGAIVRDGFADDRERSGALIGRAMRAPPDRPMPPAILVDEPRPEEITRRLLDVDGAAPGLEDPGGLPTPSRPRRRWLVPVALAAAIPVAWTLHALTRNPSAAQGTLVAGLAGESPSAAPPIPPDVARSITAPRIVSLTGDLDTDAVLRADVTYRLEHTTYVAAGATLTIEPGTTILGDVATRGTLVVRPGARIVAEGTRERPIVFTSSRAPEDRRAGDWGGVLLLGRAPTNAQDAQGRPSLGHVEGLTDRGGFGGDRPDDDSGVLRWVRIEYGGVTIGPNNEINGLTLAGVGRGTRIDHVAVRHTTDDCFEFFGGTVDAHHLVCEAPGDDAFDFDLGYAGALQFLFAFALPTDSGANGIEADGDPSGGSIVPRTAPRIANATLCGPVTVQPGERYGILLRNGGAAVIRNALVLGFDVGLDVRGRDTDLDVAHSVFGGSRDAAIAHVETPTEADGPHEDDDHGLDERAVFLPRNLLDPASGVPDCTGPRPRPVPSGGWRDHADAASNGADVDAGFVGAFADADDDWLAPAWLGDAAPSESRPR